MRTRISQLRTLVVVLGVNVIVAGLMLELAGAAFFWHQKGAIVYGSRRVAEEDYRRKPLNVVFHPFFGYVRRHEDGADMISYPPLPVYTNNHGFLFRSLEARVDYPYQPADGEAVVAIFGGSVAQHFFHHNELSGDLQRRLSALPRFQGKRIRLLNMAFAGYKQPQQMLILNYYLMLGQKFDLVLSIDGLNDVLHGAANSARGVPFAHPLDELWGNLGRYVEVTSVETGDGEAAWAQWHDWSGTDALRRADQCRFGSCYAVARVQAAWHGWRAVRLRPDPKVRQQGSYFTASRDHNVVAGRWDWPVPDDTFVRIAQLWRNSHQAAAGVAKARGIAYLGVLQPNQHYVVGRTFPLLDPNDITFRYVTDAVRRGYPQFLGELKGLRAAGVPMADGSAALDAASQYPYSDDCCHYTDSGNALFTGWVADQVGAAMEVRP